MDPYATHQRALIAAAMITEGPIVEMGCGNYSTPLLYEVAKSQGRKFTVYSTDREWSSKFTDYVDVVILESWNDFPYPENVGLTFLDNEQYIRDRKLHVPRLLQTSDVVICHDMGANEWGAKWSKSFPGSPPTVIVSDKQEVYAEPKKEREPVTVACVYKTGGDFTSEYVRRLYRNVLEHSDKSREIRFTVYTDSAEDMPGIKVPLTENLPGWWSKLELFKEFRGRTVYFDLDTIITGSLEKIYEYDGPMALIRDFYHPEIMSTGVMAWNSPMQFIMPTQEEKGRILSNPRAMDQHHIVKKLNEMKWSVDIVQDIIPLASYKADCMKNGIPDGTSIVCFHGRPRPHEVNWLENR